MGVIAPGANDVRRRDRGRIWRPTGTFAAVVTNPRPPHADDLAQS